MAKAKDQLEEERSAERSQAEIEALLDQHAELHKQHEARLAELEKHAHSDHALGKEAIDQIASHAANHALQHVDAHMRKVTGQSGLPVRGDEE